MNTHTELSHNAIMQVQPNDGPRYSMPCSFDGLTAKRMNLTCGEKLSASIAISVEYNDAILLAEIVACTHNCDDTWHVEARVEQVLSGLQSLMNLRARLMGEPVPELSRAR